MRNKVLITKANKTIKEINKDKVYYNYINNDKTIKAYKVINIVYDIETELFILTLNVAKDGVTEVKRCCWHFYTSPLKVVNGESEFHLYDILSNMGVINKKSYLYDFKKGLIENGFKFKDLFKIIYWEFDTISGRIKCQNEKIQGEKYNLIPDAPNFLVGRYNLFTQKFEGLRFNPKWRNGKGEHIYKTKEECLKATMPKVVEFEDNPQTEYVVREFKVTITAKNEDEMCKKFAKMLDLMDNL